MTITNTMVQLSQVSALGGDVIASFLGGQAQKQQYMMMETTARYNAEQARRDGIRTSEAIRKTNVYKLGKDKVAYGVSGVVGGSKLLALRDNALTREMNAVNAQMRYVQKEEELRAAAKINSRQAKQANLFSYLQAVPKVSNSASFFVSNPQITQGQSQQSSYLKSEGVIDGY